MSDRCANGWERGEDVENNLSVASDHCVAHSQWDSNSLPFWSQSGVLQLGGLAQTEPKHPDVNNVGAAPTIISAKFSGCISHLRINDAVGFFIIILNLLNFCVLIFYSIINNLYFFIRTVN